MYFTTLKKTDCVNLIYMLNSFQTERLQDKKTAILSLSWYKKQLRKHTYIGGVLDLAINSSLSLMSSLSLGYSSNLSAKPEEKK